MIDNLDLLRKYKIQNPAKYKLKFGDVPPEEAVAKLKPSLPFNLNGVSFEITEKKEKEVEFTEPNLIDPISGVSTEQLQQPTEAEKPKRGRKPKNA